MGEMSEKSVAMIEERIRQKLKGAASANAQIPSLVKQTQQHQQQIAVSVVLPTPPPIVASSNESESNILLPPPPPTSATTATASGNNNNNNISSVNENKAPMVSYTPRKTPAKNKKIRF